MAGIVVSCSSAGELEENEQVTEELEETVVDEVEEEVKIDIPHFDSDDNKCFGAINNRFASWLNTDSIWHFFPNHDILYGFLVTHSDSVGPKEILKTDPDWGPIEWQQSFTNGMTFKEVIYVEAGSQSYIYTQCTDLEIIKKNIFPLIQDEENTWNEEGTSYGPEGAGCYYDFKIEKDSTISIENYCGC